MLRVAYAARRATANRENIPNRPDNELISGFHLVGSPAASASGAQAGMHSAIWPVKLETVCSNLVFGFGPSWRSDYLYDNTMNETLVSAWLLVREESGAFTRHVLTFDGQTQGTIPAVITGTPKTSGPPIVSDPLSQTFTPDTEAYLVMSAQPPFGNAALLVSQANSGSSQLIIDREPGVSSATVLVDETSNETVSYSSVTDNLNNTWTLNLTSALTLTHALGRQVWQNSQVTRAVLYGRGERGFDQRDILQDTCNWSVNVTTNVWTVSQHGFAVGQKLVLLTTGGSPSLVQGQEVWVNQVVDTNQFTVSTTLGGATLDITGSDTSGTAWEWPSDQLAAPIRIGVSDKLTASAISAGVTMLSASTINTQPAEKLNIHSERSLVQIKADDEIRVNSHGWAAETPIVICKPTGTWSITSAHPQVGTTYYVVAPTGVNTPVENWLRISLTPGGAAFNITGSASGTQGVIAPAESVIKFTTTAGSTTCTLVSGEPVGGNTQLTNGDELLFCQITGSNGLTVDGRVFVRDVSGQTFKLCWLPDGDPITLTGGATVLAIVEEKVQMSSSQSATRLHLTAATRHRHAASASIVWQGQGIAALAPTFIAADQVSAASVGGIAGVGDSLTDDKPTLGAQPRSWLDLAGERDGVSIQNVARQGEYVGAFLDDPNMAARRKLIPTARWMTEMGTNDMGGGISLANLQILKRQIWQELGADQGIKVIACIPPPRSSGTSDNWMSVLGQTRFTGWEDLRVPYAAWLRNMVTEWVGPVDSTIGRGIMGRCDNNSEIPVWVFDLGAALESAVDSGYWRIISGLPTTRDGIHLTDNANAHLATLLDFTHLH